MAIQALQNNPQCDQLFGTPFTRATFWNPIQVISQVYSQSGGIVNQASVGTGFSSLLGLINAAATTIPNFSLNGGATVIIGSGSGSLWNQAGAAGDTLFQAETLLHELGHVYDFLPGSGGSQIQPDGFFSNGDSATNQMIVEKNCFPPKS
jgi:hypothetical protein